LIKGEQLEIRSHIFVLAGREWLVPNCDQ